MYPLHVVQQERSLGYLYLLCANTPQTTAAVSVTTLAVDHTYTHTYTFAGHSNGPTVFRFFCNLGDQWKKLLHYYGFTEEEVHSISFYSGDDDREGTSALLKVFWIPTANIERVDEILEKSKRAAGITTRARG